MRSIENPRQALNQLKQEEAQWKYSLFDGNNRRTKVVEPPIAFSQDQLNQAVKWEVQQAQNNEIRNGEVNNANVSGGDLELVRAPDKPFGEIIGKPDVKDLWIDLRNNPLPTKVESAVVYKPSLTAEGVTTSAPSTVSHVDKHGASVTGGVSGAAQVKEGTQTKRTEILHLAANDPRLQFVGVELTADQKNQLQGILSSTETRLPNSSTAARIGAIKTEQTHTYTTREETLGNGQTVILETDRNQVTETLTVFVPLVKSGTTYGWRKATIATTTVNYDITTKFPDVDLDDLISAIDQGTLDQLPKIDWQLKGSQLTLGGR